MTFRPVYLFAAVVIFCVELAIALGYIPGAFVRNSVGDILVIALIYFVIRGASKASCSPALVLSLCAGLAAESLQYFHVADLLGLKRGSALHIALGNTASFADLLMYVIGAALAVCFDMFVLARKDAPRLSLNAEAPDGLRR
ncbi:MAG TPA: DUF2809 domain-containing protein [Rhodocyclaceae bacterium]|nr:DUF2809 domain-containing protein [Rhodocyclaceae bacterium]